VPAEFQPLVEGNMDSYLRRAHSFGVFPAAAFRADLVAAAFLRQHQRNQYNFVWIVEADARFVSAAGWGDLLTRSRRVARGAKSMHPALAVGSSQARAVQTRPAAASRTTRQDQDKIGNIIDIVGRSSSSAAAGSPSFPPDYGLDPDDAHLLVFTAPVSAIASAGDAPDTITRTDYFAGTWGKIATDRTFNAAFSPLFGVSRTLAEVAEAEAAAGNGHVTHCVALPLAAQLYQLKSVAIGGGGDESTTAIINSQIGGARGENFPASGAMLSSSAVYAAWISGKTISSDDQKKSVGADFVGGSCLADFLAVA
jgi:hypothetical protein